MSDFQFKEKARKVEKLYQEVINHLSLRQEPEIKNLVSDFHQFLSEHKKQTKLTIGFIGQYGSGKSTMIAALSHATFVNKYYGNTGDGKKLIEVYRIGSKELKIGVQIITDKTESYEWEEVLLIDTPGIYADRPEHDDITLDKISKSDLLVFVIPNELFNPQSGNFFKKVALEMQRVGKMVLVINKMNRETGTPEDLTKTILRVIEPYHPDDFFTCFIDADSQLKAQNEKEEKEKQFLKNESNFTEFLKSFENLIAKNQLVARLLTPLHRSVDIIEQTLNVLTADDKLSRDFLEILRRKTLILRASQTRLKNSFVAELNKLEHQVGMVGDKVATKVDTQHNEDEINIEIKKSELEMQILSEKSWDMIQTLAKNEMSRLQTTLTELQQSDLGRSLAEEFEIAGVSKKNVGEKKIIEKEKISPILKKGPELLSKLGNFATKISREMVYDTVKFLGGKFKPWGAINATKFINKLGPILAGIGTILDVIFASKDEKDKEKYEQQLLEIRASIRKDFRQAALEIRNEFEFGWEDENGNKYEGLNKLFFNNFYQQELDAVEQQQSEISKEEKSKKAIVENLKKLLNDIKNEIKFNL